MNDLVMRTSSVFTKNLQAKTKVVINQGGTRSTKTCSLAQLFIYKMLTEKDIIISVVRKTLPSLKATAMKDFFTFLREYNLYNEADHNKTDQTYFIGNNEIEFFSLDQPQKIRGRKRDYLWINEANEATEEDFIQLILRTTVQCFLDYNPSIEAEHWLIDNVQKRNDYTLISSTFLDNPFLERTVIEEIHRLKNLDPSYWVVYGEGKRCDLQTGTIFNKIYYSEYDILPKDIKSIIYCDPNLSLKGKGDKTAVVNFGFSPKTNCYYVISAVHKSFSDSNELLNVVYNMVSPSVSGLAFDGNVTQESTWTNNVRNWQTINNLPYMRIIYRRYKVNDLAKNIQLTWNEKRILFPPGFSDNITNKSFLYQMYSFTKKTEKQHDDAPDAVICAFEEIHQRKLNILNNGVYDQPHINDINFEI